MVGSQMSNEPSFRDALREIPAWMKVAFFIHLLGIAWCIYAIGEPVFRLM